LELTANGSDTDWHISTYQLGATGSIGSSSTLSGATVRGVQVVHIDPNLNVGDLAVGHITVQDEVTSNVTELAEINAHDGETAIGRIERLADENNLNINIIGSGTATMGTQTVDTLLNLLRECETADQGILLDGFDASLTYIARSQRENATAGLSVDATSGDLVMPFAPVDDDQRNRNRVEAKRKNGSSVTIEDSTGPLGTTAIGVYDSSVTVNIDDDNFIADYAGWLVHLGTQDGYRHPDFALELGKSSDLIPAWLATPISGRVDVTNISTARTQHPTGTVSLLVEGYTEQLDQFLWTVTATCSPFNPWRIIRLAADAGTLSGEFDCHLDTNGSTLTADAAAGATTLTVATTTGPIWTVDTNDFPFDLNVGGQRVTVSAISGASSPQTFTVSALTYSRSTGTSVAVWNPPVLSL
jgi:hypothetical protein